MVWRVWVKSFMVMTALALGYAGYSLIEQAQQEAAVVADHASSTRPAIEINNASLSKQIKPVRVHDQSGNMPSIWPTSQGWSSGQDVMIKKADFVYNPVLPQIRLLVRNESDFVATDAAVRLALFLGDDAEEFASTVVLNMPWSQPLYPGEERQVVLDWPQEGAWLDEAVAQANRRRILVHIVSVKDGTHDDVDYPQTSTPLWLRQANAMGMNHTQQHAAASEHSSVSDKAMHAQWTEDHSTPLEY